MNLQQLRYLTALADEGSLTGAGRRLGVSQPVLSRALRALERELGGPLFTTAGRRLVLTPRGGQVSETARRALEAVEDVRFAALKSSERGSLRVVTTPTNGMILDRLMAHVVRLWPEVAFTLELADSRAGVIERVADGGCDVGFAERSTSASKIQSVVMTVEEIVLVSPRNLGLPSAVTVDDLNGLPMVMPSPSSRRRMLDAWLQSIGVFPTVALEADDRSAWFTAAQRGLGSFISYRSLVPRSNLPVETRSFDPPMQVELCFFFRDEPLSTPASMLIEAGSAPRVWLHTA